LNEYGNGVFLPAAIGGIFVRLIITLPAFLI
jgi:hypothetical protein